MIAIMIILMIVMVIVRRRIALKGAIQDLLQSPHANAYAQEARALSCANHVCYT